MEKTVELLMKNASLLDVELVAGALKQEGIPHFIKEKGPGGIYCGGAIMGADLYVPGECLETASITKYRRQQPSACRGTENRLHTRMSFFPSNLIFFIYFLSCSSLSSTWFNIFV